jgi:hypothetical protein
MECEEGQRREDVDTGAQAAPPFWQRIGPRAVALLALVCTAAAVFLTQHWHSRSEFRRKLTETQPTTGYAIETTATKAPPAVNQLAPKVDPTATAPITVDMIASPPRSVTQPAALRRFHQRLETPLRSLLGGDAARAWQVMDLINPLRHGRSADLVAVYKIEPYVVAADVYSVAPHTGRGGWTWYTGSAGWMYRLVVESLLGLTLLVDDDGARLLVRPCLPVGWTGYHVDYRFRETTYRIDIECAGGASPSVTVDGELQPGASIPLLDDGRAHAVRVVR